MQIYRLLNKGSGKSYIGKTNKALPERLRLYRADARRLTRDSTNTLLLDIKAFGPEKVSLTLLEICYDQDAEARRVYWIERLKTLEPLGYNFTHQKE